MELGIIWYSVNAMLITSGYWIRSWILVCDDMLRQKVIQKPVPGVCVCMCVCVGVWGSEKEKKRK